jgi:hypothetical protein
LSEAELQAAVAVFAKDEGVWDAEMEIHPGPNTEPIKMKGISTNRRMADGRWLIVDFKADSGFEGHGVYGWDASKRMYTSVWVDSMGTSFAHGEGTWDADARTMTFTTRATNRDQEIRYREVTETRPDGSQIYRNLMPTPDGGDYEMLRILYRRR